MPVVLGQDRETELQLEPPGAGTPSAAEPPTAGLLDVHLGCEFHYETAAVQDPVPALPDRVLIYTLPSRYCQSDILMDDAWTLFGDATPGYPRVQAICDWVHANVEYDADSAGPTVSAGGYLRQ